MIYLVKINLTKNFELDFLTRHLMTRLVANILLYHASWT